MIVPDRLPCVGDLLIQVLAPDEPVPPGWTLHVTPDSDRICYRMCTGDEPFSVLSSVHWVPHRGTSSLLVGDPGFDPHDAGGEACGLPQGIR